MPKFNIYAGSINRAEYLETRNFNTKEEAEYYAYE